MAYYDREYYRPDTPSGGLAAFYSTFPAIKTIITLNIAVFLLWLADDIVPVSGFREYNAWMRGEFHAVSFMSQHFTTSLLHLENFYIHTLFTYAFSQKDLLHLAFNMVFLWFLGRDLESIYGSKNFWVIYLVTAAIAGLAHCGFNALMLPIPALGASGSVMGIAVIAAFYYPDRPVYLFLLPIAIPLKYLVGFYIVLDLLQVAKIDGVAHLAHLGGAFAGLCFYKFDWRFFAVHDYKPSKGGLAKWFVRLFMRKPKLRLVKDKIPDTWPPEQAIGGPNFTEERRGGVYTAVRVEIVKESKTALVDARTAKRVDDLLDKIKRDGITALTQEERDFLEASSRKYRKE